MAKVKIAGNAAIITSILKTEDIEKVKKYTKEGLVLSDRDGNSVFELALGPKSSIGTYGVTYASKNSDGYAQATIELPVDLVGADRRAYVVDKYAAALANLHTLETYIRETLTDINHLVAEVEGTIETDDEEPTPCECCDCDCDEENTTVIDPTEDTEEE